MKILAIKTNKLKEVIDITDQVASILEHENGVACLFALHSTIALTTANLDPGTDIDTINALEKMIPQIGFKHPHDPAHAPDHILSSLVGPSLTVPVINGHPILGTWQRIVLIEFNGPRTREVAINFIREDLN